jgi:hypothetical protein
VQAARYPAHKDAIAGQIAPHLTSVVVELQQRANEYGTLLHGRCVRVAVSLSL